MKESEKLTVREIIEEFDLEVVLGEEWIDFEKITVAETSRPGLELTGYLEYYPRERIQLMGEKEMNYLYTLHPDHRRFVMETITSSTTPAYIICRDFEVPEEFIGTCEYNKVPILRTNRMTSKMQSILLMYLERRFAPRTLRHGVMVNVHGIGVLLQGRSGIGKSEIALELIKNGHQLVSDDRVDLAQVEPNLIVATPPEILKNRLEVRGIGVIDVERMFGTSAAVATKRLQLIIEIVPWEDGAVFERLGRDGLTEDILEVSLPKLEVPIQAGRNMASIVEVAVMEFKLRRAGFNAAEEFVHDLNTLIAQNGG